MPASPQPEALRELQRDIENLLQQIHHPVLVENEVALMDLTAAQWRLTVEFGKLIFSAWNSAKSFTRRVEALAYRDRDRFGIFVRGPGGARNHHAGISRVASVASGHTRRWAHGFPPATHRLAGARIPGVEV